MKISTKEIKDLLPIMKSVLGNNDLQPLTTLVGIKTTSDGIVLYTSGRDKLKVSLKVSNPDQGIDICVNANLFLGLLDKTTTEEIELSIDSALGNLVFKGNGSYNIPKVTKETGDMKYDNISTDNLSNSIGTLEGKVINTVIDNNSFALNKIQEDRRDKDAGTLSTENFHLHTDKSITSEGNLISETKLSSGLTANITIDPKTMNTLSILCKDNGAKVYVVGNDNIFIGTNSVLVSPVVNNASSFPAAALLDQIKDELFDKSADVNKSSILSAIDRLSLFNSMNEPISIVFGNNTFEVSIKGEKETLTSSGNGDNFEFKTDMTKFASCVKALNTDTVKFKFNKANTDMIRIDGIDLITAVSSI